MFLVRLKSHQIDDIDDAHFQIRKVVPQQLDRGQGLQCRHIAAHAITTSGSWPSSLLAHFQMLTPAWQCLIASSITSHWGAGCLPATITLTVVDGCGRQSIGS